MADRKEFRGAVEFKGKLVTPSLNVTAATQLTADDAGKTIFWTKGTAHDVTLPAPAAGLYFRFVIVAGSNNVHQILVNTQETDYFFGAVTLLSGHSSAEDKVGRTQLVTKSAGAAAPENHEAIKLQQNQTTTHLCQTFV